MENTLEILASKEFKRKPSTFNKLNYCFRLYRLMDTGKGFYWVRINQHYHIKTYMVGYTIPRERREMLRLIKGVLYKCVIFKESDLKGHYNQ